MAMAERPALLFVAPILPAVSGNGLAMRAGVFLDALAQDFNVTLLVVPVAGGERGAISRFVTERTHRVVTVSLEGKIDPLWTLMGRIADPEARGAAFASYRRPAMCRHATAACRADVAAAFAGVRFDAIHVLRSYMAPYAEPLLPGASEDATPFRSLDLDDDEAETHARMAAVAERSGAPDDARQFVAEAAKYERFEPLWLPHFRLLIACSQAHAQRLAAAHPASRTEVVPNTVALPAIAPWPRRPGMHILFVGNLSYLPNADAIGWFVRDVLPRVRAERGDGIVLRIAGSAPVPAVAALAELPGVELVADPRDLAACYAWADLAVVPLDAGGGTRVKLLEAFAHGVPVVSTPIGAEGVMATHEVHLLIAKAPSAFAEACSRLLADRGLAARLADAARALVEAQYAHACGVSRIRAAFEKRYSA